uniref:Uncharacterized protein n=1 Tax=Meloidogyne incognita TaxID=6306 RepID=A0A914L8D7_MELIC
MHVWSLYFFKISKGMGVGSLMLNLDACFKTMLTYKNSKSQFLRVLAFTTTLRSNLQR